MERGNENRKSGILLIYVFQIPNKHTSKLLARTFLFQIPYSLI